MIDPEGFRPNVGIILCNAERQLFWGRRVGQNAWQFPQGGIRSDETPLDAMFRELEEEVGLLPNQVTVLGSTRGWLRYRLPKRYIRHHCGPICIGQKQRWFLLRVDCGEDAFCLDRSRKPEFDGWRWVRYWQPLREVVYFKRHVYEQALGELRPLLYPEGLNDWCAGTGTKSGTGSGSGPGEVESLTSGLWICPPAPRRSLQRG